ncbi:MAG TPA: YbgC/FadM family acyl-CoA thioesterase [Hyphomonadaceae bacterium]|nr:YbgC/FadM family acyl-CoA thioesterase [Hyphomonadaceae bacterium]
MDSQHANGRFDGREHVLPLRVYYEDTDYSGIVYHANYVRYLERGRSEFIRGIGASHTSLLKLEKPITFVVAGLRMKFVRPARVDDNLEVFTAMQWVRGARIYSRQSIFRGNELILEAAVENVCVSMEGRPRRLPTWMMHRLEPHLDPALRPRQVVAANDDDVIAAAMKVAAE